MSTPWVTGNEKRLIKIVLNGMMGLLVVNGNKYEDHDPMTPFGGMLNDKEVAAVLTFVRNSFGNEAPAILPGKVNSVRAATQHKSGFYSSDELLKQHPMEK